MEKEKLSVKERIVKISNEIRLEKSGKNEFIKSNYFQPDDILKAINPLLEKYELISVFNMEYSKDIEMYKGNLIIEDFKSDERVVYHFDIQMTELKSAGRAQNAGATQTYCKRYMFMNAFNLADNKADPDNNKPAEKVNYEKKLKSAKSLVELQTIWSALPAIAKGELNILKEEIKTKLSK